MTDHRPHFVDNRDGNTLDTALRAYLRALREGQPAGNVDIATAYFNLSGFDLLAEEFGKVAQLRLLLGAEPRPEPQWPEPQPGEARDEAFTRRLVDESLRELDVALLRGRDLLPFDLETDASIRRLLALLRGGKFEVRRYTKHFLHAKAFLFRTPGGGLVTGSSNLTYAGLRKNVELNLGHFGTPAVPRVEAWFDELWSEAEPFDLAAIYDRLMAEFPPWLIYLRVLYALLDAGKVIRKELMQELSAAEDDDELFEELLESSEHAEPASLFNVEALRKDVEADRALLDQWHRRAAKVKPEHDPKLAALVEELVLLAKQAKDEATTDDDESQKRKVLVFSFYADTIDWIETFLDRALEHDKRLAVFRGRIASVAGNESRRGVTRRDAVWGFAPKSADAPKGHADKFDLLLSTDVLAEGFNLQQCRNIVNYDLPWNPMRLVQRHGRVDRIGSPHTQVFLRTFFPDDELDELLKLEARVRRKLAQAAASVGVEVSPIEDGKEGQQSFSETREEIEKLAKNDASIYERGGTESAAQTGEEYRQELRKALLRRGDEIRLLPWKAGSGMAKGKQRGHFYCAQVGKRVYLRFVPFERGPIISEVGTCLRLIECDEDTVRVMPDDLRQNAFAAWQRARQDIFDSWTYETDPANLQPKVPKLNREIAEHLRQHPPTDFEQARLTRALEAVEAPCSFREQKLLRAVFEKDFPSHGAKSRALVEEIERIGLEPFHAPEPRPPITAEDVHLICWMGVERS